MLDVGHEKLEKNQESQPEISRTSAEDEALRRNTDCVYFLASPLTCKKGSECEYRHSEAARLNPRDCYYWLNNNCTNPKCAFRHPPLDGLLGTQVAPPVGQFFPLTQGVPTPSAQALHVPGKQAVPCIFFQQGYCLKGDMCPFMHAPFSSNDKVAQLAVATPVTEFQSYKKTFGGLQKSTQQKNSQNNIGKPVEVPVQVKSVTETQMAPLRNGITANKTLTVYAGLDDELPRYKPANVHSAATGKSARSNHSQQVDLVENQSILNSKDADEFSRDHSPGFDVLVDGELGESDYYHDEDQFGGVRGRNERILNPLNDYEIERTSDYRSMADGDRDMYNDPRGYDSYDHYGRKEHRVSSDRMLAGSAHLERRRHLIADSADRTDESDLRHHLLKQKRGDNSRSVVSHSRSRENRFDDRIYRPPQRDHMRARESVISSRLRGRIKIPGRSTSPNNRTGSWSERESDRGRYRGRMSPERLHGRLKERMQGRVQEDFNNEDRSIRNPSMRLESKNNINESGAPFTGPKRLSELKVGKSESEQHVNDRQLLGKRKYPKLDGAPQQGEGDISFEGPKPLSEILKRKRGVTSADYENGSTSRNNNDNYRKEANESVMIPKDTKKPEDVLSSLPVRETSLVERNEEPKHAVADINEAGEKMKSTGDQSSLQSEPEEGLIGDEEMENHDPEAYEQAEGYSDYEQADGEDYNLEEGENLDPGDEYYEEEEDADDFAKKMGVSYS
ncbi:hypothetical protein DCAR_0726973 [Daucus carota subsp. sativus]|uniref:Uncharacterized protein n=1 Tax=Daucus carota subsp. sativus TaxID=79200 RepID=A0A161WPZ3_DAUCS|nr:PREDICTED: zinc finger CCCH domain-containing protein 17-like [Daucus carota subsp. sativus]WOH07541.1 hypothetical protein DCAR_0726973 [Daucus carota subsp. sativus]